MSDAELIARLHLPWPKDESVDEVTVPLWLLELTAEAADRIEELEAKLAQQDDLVQAAVAAKLREAASEIKRDADDNYISHGAAHWAVKTILALITPDAQAALDRVVAAERKKIKGLAIIDEAGTVTPEMWDIAAAIRKGGE